MRGSFPSFFPSAPAYAGARSRAFIFSSRPEWPIFLPRRSLARRPWSGGTVATLRRVARLLRLAILFALLRLCRRFYAFNLITQVRAWHMHSRVCFWVFRKIGMKGPAERRLPKKSSRLIRSRRHLQCLFSPRQFQHLRLRRHPLHYQWPFQNPLQQVFSRRHPSRCPFTV